MPEFDLETLLVPVSDDAPSGEDLEYDPEFMELERVAAPKAERAIGDAIKEGEEPDWGRVVELGHAILARSKDLRTAAYLTSAWTRLFGIQGWCAGLELTRRLLENFWDTVHPQLDAEDDDDPTARVNVIANLANPLGILGYFRLTPFVESPRLGSFSLRDLYIANGTLNVETSGDDATLPTMTDLQACCMDCDADALKSALDAMTQAMEHAGAIDGLLSDKVGTLGPDLKILIADQKQLLNFLEEQMAQRTGAPSGNEDDGNMEGADPTGNADSRAGGSARIESPQDVLRRLDEICAYYARHEPSSPVPLLLRRAKRLVGMDFAELLQDLAPGGMSELNVISGATDEE